MPAFLSPFLNTDPLILAFVPIVVVLLFLLFFTLRDILQRSDSFLMQIFCVLLVGALPVVGFLVYLLVRPGSTRMQRDILVAIQKLTPKEQNPQKKPSK